MQTRCPYHDCLFTFDCDTERKGLCNRCQRPMAFRRLDILQELENRRGRLFADAPPVPFTIPTTVDMYAVLEDVRSLWNVGSLFRTADGAGVGHIHLCGITGTPPRKEISKVSLGAEETISWSYHLDVLEPIRSLKARGVTILGLERTAGDGLLNTPASKSLRQVLDEGSIKYPIAILAGNEVNGLSPEALVNCDLICQLPMRGAKESLNVAVAFGVAAYMIAEHRDAFQIVQPLESNCS